MTLATPPANGSALLNCAGMRKAPDASMYPHLPPAATAARRSTKGVAWVNCGRIANWDGVCECAYPQSPFTWTGIRSLPAVEVSLPIAMERTGPAGTMRAGPELAAQ